MSEQQPDERSAGNAPSNDDSSKSDREGRLPPALTSEQRRLLGKPRPVHERLEAEKATADEAAERTVQQRRETQAPSAKEPSGESAEPGSASEEPKPGPHAGVRKPDDKSARAGRRTAFIITAIAALLLTFYVGKKFDYWRYLWSVRNTPNLGEKIPDKYPGISADELVEQGLALEHAGRWDDAGERYIAAKHKDLRYRGILFRIGKLAYDKGNFDTADRLLGRALAFGENIDMANSLRGLIATRRDDLPAAERFFEAATTAEPFTADYYYYWAETLRLEHRPKDSIARYEQAARRGRDDQDMKVCQFKVRIARLDAGENAKLKAEIEEQGSTGPLPLDWSLTEAALAIHENRIDDAVRLVTAARAAIAHTENGGGIFLSCVNDRLFQDACRKSTALANACEFETTPP
jgi:tetratricopeptide (TPR) repeat protein